MHKHWRRHTNTHQNRLTRLMPGTWYKHNSRNTSGGDSEFSVNMHALWLKHLNFPLVPYHTVLHSACSSNCLIGPIIVTAISKKEKKKKAVNNSPIPWSWGLFTFWRAERRWTETQTLVKARAEIESATLIGCLMYNTATWSDQTQDICWRKEFSFFCFVFVYLSRYRPLCIHASLKKTNKKTNEKTKTWESTSLYVARLRDTVLFSFLSFFYFLLFRCCSLQSDVGAEIGGKRQAVVLFFFFFNLCFRKCLNKQYAAQSRVCFSARQAFSLEAEQRKQRNEGEGGEE